VALAQHQRKDGSIVEMELVSHECEAEGRRARLVLATDVTERARTRAALRRSEEQLRQIQRMDAVGRLVGGVAHDFNNLLTTIRGFSEIVLQELSPDDVRRKDMEQIKKAADRGAQLTRQLLVFGQQQALHPRPLALNEIVGVLDALIQRLLSADVLLVTHLQPDIGRVRMDPGQLEQVLVNLVLNARDAMPAGGTLTIETSQRQITRPGRGRPLRPGDYVVLAVSDTGAGLDGEALQHLFEPFFSNKPQGQRAGLGLAIVHGIVRQSGGVIRVASEPGRGTTVKIYLPRLEEAEPETAPVPHEFQGSETVLVAEDEDGVRELLRKILAEHGHVVLQARHGRDALLTAERYQNPIDLLVTDVVMPELGGGALAEQLVQRRPGLKVLYISGYTNDEVLSRGVDHAGAAFIQKPFTADDLMRKVRELLDGGVSSADAIESGSPDSAGH
jgi:signal transduction histidine kinase/ActR/RegA family two-component response regulator